jgi:glycosyltransferase involved in cell wall biosynthesis
VTNRHSTVIVTPVFEDSEAAGHLFQELTSSLGNDIYVVAVDDGSVGEPLGIGSISSAGIDGAVITLKRNVGHQRALAIGLSWVEQNLADYQRVVVMDSDGEDLPSSIADLVKPLDAGGADIVVAERRSRFETFRFRAFYFVYRGLFKLLSGQNISFGNFMALKPVALKRLVAMQELWIHLAGCVLSSKLRVVRTALDRGPRYAGKSKMNFVGLALHGFRGLMIFAEDVLVRVGMACALIASLSIVGGAAAIMLKVLGFATPGWFSVALGILLLVFLQTGTLTLMTLMLTGVVKGSTVSSVDYHSFVDRVECTGGR